MVLWGLYTTGRCPGLCSGRLSACKTSCSPQIFRFKFMYSMWNDE